MSAEQILSGRLFKDYTFSSDFAAIPPDHLDLITNVLQQHFHSTPSLVSKSNESSTYYVVTSDHQIVKIVIPEGGQPTFMPVDKDGNVAFQKVKSGGDTLSKLKTMISDRTGNPKFISIVSNLILNLIFVFIAFNLLERAEYHISHGHYYNYTGWVIGLGVTYILLLLVYFRTGSLLFLITTVASIRFLYTSVKDIINIRTGLRFQYEGRSGVTASIAKSLVEDANMFINGTLAVVILNVVCLLFIFFLRKKRKKAIATLSLGT